LVVLGVCFYAAVTAAALFWRVGLYGEPIFFASAADAAATSNLARDFALGLLVGIGVVCVSFLCATYTGWGRAVASELAAAIGTLGMTGALLLAFASGLAEEMFFRGALQPRVGLLPASILFAGMHFIPRRTLLPWTAFALVAGLLLGGLFQWTGNLLAPVTAHIVVNAVNLPLLERRFGATSGEP
jgi:membrane protease YdiL (CAAX protease family)